MVIPPAAAPLMSKAVVLSILLVLPGHKLRHKQDSSQLAQHQTNHQPSQSLPPKDDAQPAPCKQNATNESPPWWKNPEAYLAILGFPTLGFVAWQAYKTHQATEAGRLASVAARRQVQQFINAERAWIMVEVSGGTTSGFRFTAHNVGKTPAKIIWMDPLISARLVPLAEHLPSLPPYNFGFYEGGELTNGVWVAPGAQEPIGTFDSFEAFGSFDYPRGSYRDDQQRLFIYSAIKYVDTLTEAIHESRFCYRLGGRILHMDGPQGYNDYT